MKLDKRSAVAATAAELYAWHARARAFERLNPPFDPVELVSRSGPGGLKVGTRVTVNVKVGPLSQPWVAEHTADEPGRLFRDEQRDGPFSRWVHTHRFADGELHDEIDFSLPVGESFAAKKLEKVFGYRHAVTRADFERHNRFKALPRQRIAITGINGLIGNVLAAYLDTAGHEIVPVKRGDFGAVDGCDAVIHLAGAPIGTRWTKSLRVEIVTSRVDYTRSLVAAMKKAAKPPRVLLSGSAIGVYGDRGDEVLTEDSTVGARAARGAGFLAGLCEDWEAEALKADARVVLMRTGVVLTPQGGALSKMLPPFQAGAGGPLGDGKQWMSWISVEDMLGAIEHALHTETVSGPLNLTAPSPHTGNDFAKELGRVLHRPSFARVPSLALELLYGESARAALLASQRVLPKR
ncbi:MAG: TIGR01777 family oxidoreductase, partial [Myxococcaceae bacterium]|nr:TIGR01777 family oxidoreductase [Myxococcaceae bacterium]